MAICIAKDLLSCNGVLCVYLSYFLPAIVFNFTLSHCVLLLLQFEGAYNLLRSVQEMNQPLTASMFNAIMAGHFKEASDVDIV